MKKFILPAILLGAITMGTSCIKQRNCSCTSTGGGSTSTESITVVGTKKGAKAACASYEESYTSGGTSYSKTCEVQ
jgi:hypothetical protein